MLNAILMKGSCCNILLEFNTWGQSDQSLFIKIGQIGWKLFLNAQGLGETKSQFARNRFFTWSPHSRAFALASWSDLYYFLRERVMSTKYSGGLNLSLLALWDLFSLLLAGRSWAKRLFRNQHRHFLALLWTSMASSSISSCPTTRVWWNRVF